MRLGPLIAMLTVKNAVVILVVYFSDKYVMFPCYRGVIIKGPE